MLLQLASSAIHLAAPAPSPAAASGVESSQGIIVTAITTVGIIAVAVITSIRKRDTGPSPQVPAPAASVDAPVSPTSTLSTDDTRLHERLAVLEYQVRELNGRLQVVEERSRQRGSR